MGMNPSNYARPARSDNTPVTIVIPVYNEEKIMSQNIQKLTEYLRSRGIKYEIRIFDNGSTDATADIGRRLEKEFKNVMFFSIRQKGLVGRVFKEAVKNSSYEKIVSMDMDMSVDLDFIPECARLLDTHSIVIGSKKMGTQKRSLIRRLASGVFISLVKVLLRIGYDDYSMAAKGYRKKDIIGYIDIVSDKSAYVFEIIYMAWKRGLKIIEIPVTCNDNRKSKFNFLEEIFHRFTALVSFRARLFFRKLQ